MKSEKDVNIGKTVAIIWTIFAYIGAILIGLEGIAIFGKTIPSEEILPTMVIKLFPAAIAGVLLAGAIAAMMSTGDSQLLVAASSISEDIIHKGMKKNISDKRMVTISRITVLTVGIFSLILALTPGKNLIYTIVSWAWAGIGCSFSPAVILAFFWDRFSSSGIVATLVAGLVTTIIWITTGLDKVITTRFITFAFALIFGIIFTYIFPKKSEANVH